MTKGIALTEIVDFQRWQSLQDHFGQAIGVSVRTVDKTGNLIARPSNPTRFCEEILKTSVGIARCGKCLPSNISNLMVADRWKEGYQCHAGLHIFCVPVIAFDNTPIAYILVGPVFLGRRRETQGYQQLAKDLGISLDTIIDCITEIKLFTFAGIQSVIELINDMTCYVAQLGYRRFKLERMIPLPKISKFVHRYYLDKILKALLDVSSNAAGTESGSIMLLDKRAGELYIKIARGLNNDIIENTRLKTGEGVAGLAVKERRSLLLDNQLTDDRIKARLRRPEIKSAFVIPINVDNETLGVMSISTSSPSVIISAENIDTLQRLIELTETTLADLHKL